MNEGEESELRQLKIMTLVDMSRSKLLETPKTRYVSFVFNNNFSNVMPVYYSM